MSRFGLRKKLRSLIHKDTKPVIQTCAVCFVLPDGTEKHLDVEQHYSLLMAADAHGITISTGRRAGGTCPDGMCGFCRVEILEPQGLSEMKTFEQQVMDDHTNGVPHEGRPRDPAPPPTPNTRLGCHAKIRGSGAKIQIQELFDPESIRGSESDD